jgi:hypothetical protein
MRGEFEAAFIAEQVLQFGEGYRDSAVFMLKRSGEFGFDRQPTQYELSRREKGLYDTYWVETVWWAWQASRAAVVVDLPEGLVSADGQGVSLDGFRVVAAIEAAGLKVAP